MNLEDVMSTHADRAAGPVLTLHDVQQRAQRIQRRRRTAAATAVGAAVVAVVVPVSLVVSGPPDSAPRPGPATRVPSVNADAVQQDPLDMRVARAEPGGAPPTVAWIEGRTLHRPDGSVVELEHDYEELDVVGDDTYLAVRRGNDAETDGSSLDEIGEDGAVVSSRLVTPNGQASVVTSPDGSVAAWTTPEGDVQVWDRDGEQTLAGTGRGDQTGNVVAVFGSGTCDASGEGCRVVVNDPDGDPLSWSEDGSEPVGGGFLHLGAMSPDGVLATGNRGEATNGNACSTTWDLQAGEELHRCQSSPFDFSPDGRHAGEWPSQADVEPASVQLTDARTGAPVARIVTAGTPEESYLEPVAWEDAEHFLLPALHRGRWLLLRGDLDGRLEIVEGPTGSPDPEQPFQSPFVVAR